MKETLKDKVFLKQMFSIAIPITLQSLIASSLNMVDTLMISDLGQSSIAAVGLANQLFFFFILIVFGIHSGSSIFVSQFWGKKDTDNIKRILGLSISLCIVVGLIFTLLGLVYPEMVMKFFIKDANVVKLGSDYLRIVSLSYIMTGVGFAYSVAARSIGEARMPMIVSGIAFVTNTVFNYLLIFGKFGFPELGVRGAAYGTLIARIVEFLFIIFFVYKGIKPLAGTISEMTDWTKEFVSRYFRTTSPVILNEALWALGQVMYSVAYARIGEEATAAVQIATTIQNIFFVMIRGLANACTVMVGNKIGSGDEEGAYDYAKQFLLLATISGLVLGGVLALTPDLTLKLFRNLDPDLYNTSRKMLIVLGLFYSVKTFNATLIVGVLRGGGDTKFSMYLEMVSVWIVGVPLAFIGAIVLKLEVHQVILLVTVEEILKFIVGYPRVKSKKWIKDVT